MTSNPTNVFPTSRLHQQTDGQQANANASVTSSRPNLHHKWTTAENFDSNGNQVATPSRRELFSTPQRDYRATPKRSDSVEYCGLTVEIKCELHQRSATKTPRQGGASRGPSDEVDNTVTFISVGNTNIMQTPPRVTRKRDEIFRVFKTNELTLAPTISASYSEDVLPKEDEPAMPQQASPSTQSKPKRGISSHIRMKTKIFGAKKLNKCLTPPREAFASHIKQLQRENTPVRLAVTTMWTPLSVDQAPLSPLDEFKIHSAESDPFDFQCELPQKREICTHANVCNVVDSYTSIHLNFNFAMLAGLTRSTLEKEYERSSEHSPMIAGSCHRDVVKGVLDCEDDLVVEGFFREYVGQNVNSTATVSGGAKATTPAKATPAKVASTSAKDDRIEAIIFSSEKLRQIIVCFRGSTANQAKPLKTNYFGKEGSSILHEDHQVRTLSAFRDAYFGTPMEETVFALLANLATLKPFFDVVMTGHSFGAALATISAMRYATAHPMMRVSCHVFGCPRIGGEDWRQLVHSIANLKVFRVENVGDPYVALPIGSEWVQVGHAISILDVATDCNSGTATNTNTNGISSNNAVRFAARRFDRDRIATSHGMLNLIKCPEVNLPLGMTHGFTTQGKLNHEMKRCVDKLVQSGNHWFTDFIGMQGNGVISFADNERRLLA